MLEDSMLNDILAESMDISHPILDMLWDSHSFFEMMFSMANLPVNQNTIGIIGDTKKDHEYWDRQESKITSALVAEGTIIHAMTGIDIPKEELLREATAQEWFDETTFPRHLGKMLSLYDISYHINENGTTADIIRELVQGHKVIVAVNVGELLSNNLVGLDAEHFENIITETLEIQTADHAIWITEVDLSDPEDIKIIVSDHSFDDGGGKIYSLFDFVDAWEDSGFYYIATDEPPPDLDQVVSGFDVETGTFPEIADYFESHYQGFLEGNLSTSVENGTSDSLIASVDPDSDLTRSLGAAELKVAKPIFKIIQELVEHLPEVRNFKPGLFTRASLRLFDRIWEDIPEENRDLLDEDEREDFNPPSVMDATIAELIASLEQGHPVIAVVDTGGSLGIAGIDMSGADPRVIINVSGDPDQAEQVYSVDEFTNTWADARFHYVVIDVEGTAEPAPRPALTSIVDLSEAERDKMLSG